MRVFNYSVAHLMAPFAFLLVGRWLLPYLQPASLLELKRVERGALDSPFVGRGSVVRRV